MCIYPNSNTLHSPPRLSFQPYGKARRIQFHATYEEQPADIIHVWAPIARLFVILDPFNIPGHRRKVLQQRRLHLSMAIPSIQADVKDFTTHVGCARRSKWIVSLQSRKALPVLIMTVIDGHNPNPHLLQARCIIYILPGLYTCSPAQYPYDSTVVWIIS